jgi:hypothetical protein
MAIRFPILACRERYNTADTIGQLARVSKYTARNLHAQGVEVIIVAHKFTPFVGGNGVAMVMPKNSDWATDDFSVSQFDNIVASYVRSNCMYETGYYPAFYVRFDTYSEYRARFKDRFVGVIHS